MTDDEHPEMNQVSLNIRDALDSTLEGIIDVGDNLNALVAGMERAGMDGASIITSAITTAIMNIAPDLIAAGVAIVGTTILASYHLDEKHEEEEWIARCMGATIREIGDWKRMHAMEQSLLSDAPNLLGFIEDLLRRQEEEAERTDSARDPSPPSSN